MLVVETIARIRRDHLVRGVLDPADESGDVLR